MNTRFLESFFIASQDLANTLKSDRQLSQLEQLRLENHLTVMNLAYLEWKQRNGFPNYLSALMNERKTERGEHNSRPSTRM